MNAEKVWPFPSSGAPASDAVGDDQQQEQGEAQGQRPSSDPNQEVAPE